MIRKLKRLLAWWYWWKWGICPIHLTLAAAGGSYAPKWICNQCDRENRIKNEDRVRKYEQRRRMLAAKLKGRKA